MTDITIIRPDDWHIHLRDGEVLEQTVKDAARYFGRAIVMPNLLPPVTNTKAALAYRQRILAARDQHAAQNRFNPLMTLYLTDNTQAEDIEEASNSEHIVAAKLYPAGATTHSNSGVTDLKRLFPVLEAMQKCGMPLLIHGEVTDHDIDIFDREKLFVDRTLSMLVREFPALKIVLEHITTADAAQFVLAASAQVGATITAHHLLYNRNDMLAGGIRPHYYCLPILKRNRHQQALVDAATSGNPKFFLGTDSAPHSRTKKETRCGCAGCYTAYAAIEMYAEVFERANALDKLESFASRFGADFYGLPHNSDRITLTKTPWTAPTEFSFGEEILIPLRAGEKISWQVKDCRTSA